MKQVAAFWSDSPRWARGLFLGNLCYIVLALVGFNLIDHSFGDQIWLMGVLSPLLWPMLGTPISSKIVFLYHLAWCLLGAIFVQWLGEAKGLLLLILLPYFVGIAILIYALTHFSFSF